MDDMIAKLQDRGVYKGNTVKLEMRFGGVKVDEGGIVGMKEGWARPEVKVVGGWEVGKEYCLVCYDPDAPYEGAPVLSDIPHLVVWNYTSGAPVEVVGWRPPTPPFGTHRYIFLICEQLNTAIGSKPPRLFASIPTHLEKRYLAVVGHTYFRTPSVFARSQM
eukprot:TRINITY_DN17197_c0_g1_i2.p2 TRINITY_DN17197_c0_g1~~TRINITY_DN17197_c0_g1_i2.p2  ORF type:complete len:162 (+),score=28.30 TRINITY_DN17197_c0_g1_i2:616-1101(+)